MEKLVQSNEELDDFAYTASHDLQEPVRNIQSVTNFLIEDHAEEFSDPVRARIDSIQKQCVREIELINSLLYYSRLGRSELTIHKTDLDALVREVLDSLQESIRKNRVELCIPRRLPTISCDPILVREIYQNLIANAIKYNDKPQKRIEIGYQDSTETQHSSQTTFVPELYVRDNGIGIRDSHLNSIFKISKRLHAREKFGGGMGAGLTIVKKIVEKHLGRIWVESIYGKGTTFYFSLNPSLGTQSWTTT